MTAWLRHSAAPYVVPFCLFIALLSMMPRVDLPPRITLSIWIVACGAAIVFFSRDVLDFRCTSVAGSIAVGVGVFVVWILPDLLVPGWRQHWLLQNDLMGHLKTSLHPGAMTDPIALALRFLRAVAIVPIVEELFWRGWMMRWIVKPEFERVPLGTYTALSFWAVAVLFALEHGPYWEVGLVAGGVYNWWIVRTKRLGDLFLAHAVTNACLSAFVVATQRWEYWM